MPTTANPQTLFDKLWQRHLVEQTGDGKALLYVDRHLVYEVTSPQAFEGLRLAARLPWRRETVIATVGHNMPTTPAERRSSMRQKPRQPQRRQGELRDRRRPSTSARSGPLSAMSGTRSPAKRRSANSCAPLHLDVLQVLWVGFPAGADAIFCGNTLHAHLALAPPVLR
jgi:hypothetical protein